MKRERTAQSNQRTNCICVTRVRLKTYAWLLAICYLAISEIQRRVQQYKPKLRFHGEFTYSRFSAIYKLAAATQRVTRTSI